MKTLDYIILAVFIVGLVILCFFQNCRLDIYFLVLGFAVAAMSAGTMFLQKRKNKRKIV
jgi:L-asparagine transporter-like permease